MATAVMSADSARPRRVGRLNCSAGLRRLGLAIYEEFLPMGILRNVGADVSKVEQDKFSGTLHEMLLKGQCHHNSYKICLTETL